MKTRKAERSRASRKVAPSPLAQPGGDGPIGLIVLSRDAKGGGYSNTIHYTHSSTLRTVQEIFGVTDHIRELCDEYAQDGYEVLSPNLFDRQEPGFEAEYAGPSYDRAIQIARGAMLPTTEMTPWPPQAMYGSTVKSSPER